MRKLIFGFLALLALVVVAVVVLVETIDLDSYRPEIEAELEAATGRDVTIGGSIQFALTPSLAIAVSDVAIAGIEGGSGEPLALLPQLQAVVALLPLLGGEVEIERIRLVEPVVVLERNAEGAASWELTPAETSGGETMAVSVARFEVEDGTVVWRDGAGERRFEAIALSASALSLEGPFEGQGGFVAEGVAWTLVLDVGRTSRPQIPLNVTLAAPDAKLQLAGSLDLSGEVPGFSGQAQAEGDDLAAALALGGLDAGLPGLADMAFALDSGLSASAEGVRLADAVVTLGEMRMLGAGELRLGEAPALDLALSANMIDLDALFAGEAPSAATEDAGEGEEAEAAVPFAIPAGMTGQIDVAVDAVVWRGEAIRQARIVATLAEGAAAIKAAEAQLPGGSAVALAGTVESGEDGLAFRGPVELTTDNLRATLAWAGLDLAEVPADRLRRVDLTATLVLEPGVVALQEIDLRFDSTRLTGAVAARTGDRPGLAADIAADSLNLDAYLPPRPAEAEADAGDAAAAPFAMPQLPDLDIELEARIDELTYNGVAVGGFVADGSLKDGRLEIASLGAADVAGAALRTSGTVDPAAQRIDLRLGAEADDAGGLLRLLGIVLPIDPARLGNVALSGEIVGGTDSAVIRQRLDTGLGQASVDGTVLDVLGTPGFDGRLGLRATSYRTLAAALDIALPEAADSELAFAADLTTDGNAAETSAVLELLGLTVRASGTTDGLQQTPAFDLRLAAEHGELGDLLAALGAGGGGAVGPLALSLGAKGDTTRFDVTLAPSSFGPSELHGTAAFDLTGARPRIEARLQAGELALDPLLAASSGGTLGDAQGAAAEGERWSAEPLDLGTLQAFDGRLELVAERAMLQGMAFGEPTIVATLADGTLAIERFDGSLFDGRFTATGRIAAGVPHRIDLVVALADADARQLLERFADSDRVTGRIFLDATVDTSGLSQRDLVGALAGTGEIALRDGIVQGFDLGSINQRLGNLDNEAAIVALLADAGTGGQTRILAADGTFAMSGGVARSDDLRTVLDGGEATFVMTVDLPRWLLDLEGEARLTGHADAPTIPITVAGPIDAPTTTLDTGGIEAFLMRRAAETALRKLGDGEDAGAAGAVLDVLTGGATQPAEEPAEVPVEVPSVEVPAEVPPEVSVEEPAAPLPEEQPATTPEQDPAAAAAGTLLDLLTGAGQTQQGEGEAAPAENAPAAPAQEGEPATLDTDVLLQDLLEGLGN